MYFEGRAGGGKGGIADGFGGPIPPGGLGWPMPPSGDASSIGPEGRGRPGIDGGNGGPKAWAAVAREAGPCFHSTWNRPAGHLAPTASLNKT